MLEVDIRKKILNLNINCIFKLENEVLALLGESGAGKTTILNCIAGLVDPDEGTIISGDKYLYSSEKGINISPQERNVGYVFQDYALFPHLTVRENVAISMKDKNSKEVEDILEAFKLSSIRDKKTTQISGGEKQRTAFARALLKKPDLLLLDEPFSALDQNTKVMLYKEFHEFRKKWNIGTIMVTHNLFEAELLSDKILEIKDGIVIRERYNHLTGKIIKVDRHEYFTNIVVQCGELTLSVTKPEYFSSTRLKVGEGVSISVRPERLIILKDKNIKPEAIGITNIFQSRVKEINETKRSAKIYLSSGGNEFFSAMTLDALNKLSLAVGEEIWCLLDAEGINIFSI